MNKIKTLLNIIDNSNFLVFFGGAGVSTLSGIPDFRSANGLYNQKFDYEPEYMLSHTFYDKHTEEFFDFYRTIMMPLDAKPNIVHTTLNELEKAGKLKAVITQNIDGLHQAAGNDRVFEIHGSIHRNYCTDCGKMFDATYIKNSTGIPKCECGGTIKPDVVLYEENLPTDVVGDANDFVSMADTLIIAGTSLAVYPANNVVHRFHGKNLIIINNSPTEKDRHATLIIRDDLGKVFNEIHNHINE